ncbi:MAG: hypothetical protein RL136_706 [Planctomycetota bacterium]|jgi:membrane-bound serine protease (ClpP class)
MRAMRRRFHRFSRPIGVLVFLVPVLAALLMALPASVAGSPASGATAAAGAAQARSIPSERKATRVAVIPITGAIDSVTLWSVERRLRSAVSLGYDAVVFELDTPGGEVGAMLGICLRIKSEAPANTVAWIRPMAYSAGTFIALSCREVVVAPGSVFGDAAPIAAMPGVGVVPLPAAERAKQESPLLDELDAAASRRGDDPRLLRAFVAVEQELWLIEHATDGTRRFADRAELERIGLDPAAMTAVPIGDNGALPTPPAARPLAESDRGAWRLVERVDADSTLLVVQSDEALRWGLAAAAVKDDGELRDFFLADELRRFPEHWSESVVRILVSWPARILLIGIFIVALVIEGMHPGIGAAGAVAACALLLLVGAPGLLGLAQWWEILLVALGVVLVAVEVLVIPGIGIAGVAGAICIVVGLVASFTGTDPTSATERSALVTAVTTTLSGLVLGVILTWVSSRWIRESPLFRRAVLSAAIAGGGSQPLRDEPAAPAVGARGIADTDLRPSGRARFGDDLFDAQSTGEYIARATSIVVVARNGSTLVVEASSDRAPAGETA